jgi:hypothetical protein
MTSALDLTPLTGTVTAGATPSPNCSVLVEKKTNFAGVRYRGRMSVPPCNIPENTISVAGVISNTELAVQQGMWDWVFSTLGSAGFNPYLFHAPSKPGTVHPTTAPARTQIINFTVSPLIGTNRRRLR